VEYSSKSRDWAIAKRMCRITIRPKLEYDKEALAGKRRPECRKISGKFERAVMLKENGFELTLNTKPMKRVP